MLGVITQIDHARSNSDQWTLPVPASPSRSQRKQRGIYPSRSQNFRSAKIGAKICGKSAGVFFDGHARAARWPHFDRPGKFRVRVDAQFGEKVPHSPGNNFELVFLELSVGSRFLI
jgi:hypothetical protein